MDGGEVALGPCARCGGLFTFDPETVPSVWCDVSTGLPREPVGVDVDAGLVTRLPLCEECAPVVRAAAHAGRSVSWRPSR